VRSELRVDEWVMPSHFQIARVLDGGLDAAIAWAADADERLHLQLLWAEPLGAVVPARIKDETIAAGDLRMVVGNDSTSWGAWNQFARDFAEATGARIVEVDDGSIAGPGFYERCLKLKGPVLHGPKRAVVPMPAGLRIKAVREPTPLWCWSLVTRADDDRPSILALRDNADKVTRAAGLHALPSPSTWVPPHDPHRDTIAALPVA
jgi:hypothetical protein